MTAPTAPQQPTQQPEQQQGQGQQVLEDAAIVAGLAVLLAAVTPSMPSIVSLLTRPPARQGEIRVSRPAAIAAAQVVLKWGQPDTEPLGVAGKRMQRLNVQRRAQYLLNAARRITRQLGSDRSKEAVIGALQRERQYWRQHVQAGTRREQAAALIDSTAEQHGVPVQADGKPATVLGWRAVIDSRTDPQCRTANGKNWLLERPPRIGLPGTVHPACRCVAVPPWPTRELVGGGRLPSLP